MGAGYALFGASGGDMPKIAYGTLLNQDDLTIDISKWHFTSPPVFIATTFGGGYGAVTVAVKTITNQSVKLFTSGSSYSGIFWIAIGE